MKAIQIAAFLSWCILGVSSTVAWKANMLVIQPLDSDCHQELPQILRRIANLIWKKIDPDALIVANGKIRRANLTDIGLARNPCKIVGYCQSYPNACLLLGCPLGGVKGRRRELGRHDFTTNNTNTNTSTTPSPSSESGPEGLPSEEQISRAGTKRIRSIHNTFPACKIDQLEFIFNYE